MDIATIIATVYAIGFVATAVVAASNIARRSSMASDIEAGASGLLAGLVWPLVVAAWAVGQVGVRLRRP